MPGDPLSSPKELHWPRNGRGVNWLRAKQSAPAAKHVNEW
jgi:hypothetical protein